MYSTSSLKANPKKKSINSAAARRKNDAGRMTRVSERGDVKVENILKLPFTPVVVGARCVAAGTDGVCCATPLINAACGNGLVAAAVE